MIVIICGDYPLKAYDWFISHQEAGLRLAPLGGLWDPLRKAQISGLVGDNLTFFYSLKGHISGLIWIYIYVFEDLN